MSPTRAVLFDFNGTLSHDEPIWFEVYRELYAERGRPITREEEHHQPHLMEAAFSYEGAADEASFVLGPALLGGDEAVVAVGEEERVGVAHAAAAATPSADPARRAGDRRRG